MSHVPVYGTDDIEKEAITSIFDPIRESDLHVLLLLRHYGA